MMETWISSRPPVHSTQSCELITSRYPFEVDLQHKRAWRGVEKPPCIFQRPGTPWEIISGKRCDASRGDWTACSRSRPADPDLEAGDAVVRRDEPHVLRSDSVSTVEPLIRMGMWPPRAFRRDAISQPDWISELLRPALRLGYIVSALVTWAVLEDTHGPWRQWQFTEYSVLKGGPRG